MQNQVQTKPSSRSSKIVSIATAINCLGTFLIGRLWINMILPQAKLAPAGQIARDQLVIFLAVLLYLILSIVALNVWIKGKQVWDFILLGLSSLHFVSLYYLSVYTIGELLSIFFIPLVLDVVILLTVILDKRYSKTSNL